MLISEALNSAAIQIARISKDNPRQQAQWLLQSVLPADAAAIFADRRRQLTPDQMARLQLFIRRRLQNEPLQYILGAAEFRRIRLKVDRRALIPRPETEGLVEIGLELIRKIPDPTILDVGVGCGAIALSLLDEHPGAGGLACDVSQEALDLAAENARALNLDNRLAWKMADLFDPGFAAVIDQRFALVASNPPYVSENEYRELPAEIRDYEPAVALLAGKDGLDAIHRLAQIGQELLEDGGHLICEIGERQKAAALQIFDELGWDAEVRNDLNGKPRYLVAAAR